MKSTRLPIRLGGIEGENTGSEAVINSTVRSFGSASGSIHPSRAFFP
ncbi:hypothetical protein [Paenibacillus rigui]|nr:hypothetical protein [Paenibacillus rigui]